MEQKKTVLIVEDEKNIVDIIRFNLQRTGYNTLEAYDGEAGLAMAREKKPDLILLDVMMPKMMGFDVCRALRAEGLAALMLEQPLLYRLTGACRVVLYPVGQTKTITLYLTRQQAEELADVLLPVTDPLWHAPKGGEKLAFTAVSYTHLTLPTIA